MAILGVYNGNNCLMAVFCTNRCRTPNISTPASLYEGVLVTTYFPNASQLKTPQAFIACGVFLECCQLIKLQIMLVLFNPTNWNLYSFKYYLFLLVHILETLFLYQMLLNLLPEYLISLSLMPYKILFQLLQILYPLSKY